MILYVVIRWSNILARPVYSIMMYILNDLICCDKVVKYFLILYHLADPKYISDADWCKNINSDHCDWHPSVPDSCPSICDPIRGEIKTTFLQTCNHIRYSKYI